MKRNVGPLDKRRRVTRCQPCRQRRIKCEGGFPCEYCIRTNKICEPQKAAQTTVGFISFTGPNSTSQLPMHMGRHDNAIYLDYFMSFMGRCQFTKGFGSINTDLMPLIQASPSLRDLAVAIGALEASRRGSVRSTGETKSPEVVAFNSYGKSIRALQTRLAAPDAVQREDVLWGTFLLGLFELISEPSGERWAKHMLYGTSRILQLSGPNEPLSPLRWRLFEAFRALEANRVILYGDDSFLSQSQWLCFQRGQPVAAHQLWGPMEAVLALIIRASSFSKRFFDQIESIPLYERHTNPSIHALASEGLAMQKMIVSWRREIESTLDNEDTYTHLAIAYYHALLLFLTRNYTYYSCWGNGAVPSLTRDETAEHTNAIISLAEKVVAREVIPGVMLLFPLRMAGAHATHAHQRDKVMGMLGQIYRTGFIVSDRILIDLQESWDCQENYFGLPYK